MNMTGFWAGTYWYFVPNQPVVRFIANIDDNAGIISGSTSEQDSVTGSDIRVEAFLKGTRDDAKVKFAKVYDGAGPLAHRVDYSGALSDDGSVLAGSWYLSGEWGGFQMSRQILPMEEELSDERTADLVTGSENGTRSSICL
jgi:hypothetical protein